MDLLSAIFECICCLHIDSEVEPNLKEEDVAEKVVRIIVTTEKRGPALQAQIQGTVNAEGWTEEIAKAVLLKLQQVIEKGQSDMGAPLREAIASTSLVVEEIFQFARDHPVATTVFCTLVAIGVLVSIAPWIIEAVGFGRLGPIEGTFAAWWQSTYRGYVTKDSLFAFFQRLRMTWH